MLQFFHDSSGVTTIEYGLIAALVTVGAVGAMDRFGQALDDQLFHIINAISALI